MNVGDVLAKEDGTDFAIALSDLVFGRYDSEGFASLRPAEQVALCVDALEREVANGGLDQFFFNSSGDQAHETLSALETIGAKQAAKILREAMAVFPGGVVPTDRDQRCDVAMAALPESARETWSELDGRFYEYPDNITELMRAYVKAHRDEFRPWP